MTVRGRDKQKDTTAFFKKLKYRWKRFRRRLKDQPAPLVYAHKKERLTELLKLEAQGAIDLFFADECGFSLTPCLPYGWQPIGERYTIRSAKDWVTNLFGLLSRRGKLITYATSHSVTGQFIVECIDEVAERIDNPTVIVVDNAPWHTSAVVQSRQKVWAHKDLYLFFLPTYSPQLNSIEILWKKIKYEWLRAEDYTSVTTLKEAIFNIIRKYNEEFCID
ncbi:MAG: IS630 family transposase, partial [Bacteroidota bacterium]